MDTKTDKPAGKCPVMHGHTNKNCGRKPWISKHWTSTRPAPTQWARPSTMPRSSRLSISMR